MRSLVNKNLIRGLLIAAVIICFDQLTKWLIVDYIMASSIMIPINNFFNLVLTFNRGVSFGLFASTSPEGKWILICLTSGLSCILIWWLYNAKTNLSVFAFGMIIGGAIGNIIDRLRIGAVVDFLDFYAFGYHWPAFNIADASICVGATLLVFESLFAHDKLD